MSFLTEFSDIAKTISTGALGSLVIAVVIYLYRSKGIIKVIKQALDAYISELGKVDSIAITIVQRVFKANSVLLDVSMLLNSSAFLVVEVLAKEIADSDVSAKDRKANTIVGVMLLEKAKKGTIQQSILILGILAHLFIVWLTDSGINQFVLLFLAVLLLAVFTDQKLMEFRIRKGWYGSNEFETRELIEFITLHSNKDDFNDGNGAKRIIPNPELDLASEHEESKGEVVI
ncbi:hypothetical protein [Vibrio sp. 10N.222.55.B11]|uniref:hypothetical protein n=1 Tax=Vibrio sp. 10N.222.55.B11 TaxID=3229648 RepID=UPI002A726575|nr:conserved membrane hypothetical protein [Vibrio crassostreae]CAK2511232.1 conserved membrane hypothetical protein [Vibrio crassostreae]CAK2515189.1 conserved membrane hypothetical protein [Vibrio crassostreae]CAK2898060.1 conserved membrane hypothetical protein [Vibrio crassostreae]CAK2914969.1 conserved membrane hypothetical protein [Vibrio crassostreae]